jgi:hypothetical protein
MLRAMGWVLTVFLCGAMPCYGVGVFFDEDCLPQVLKVIRETKRELVVSVFDINHPEIVDALIQAHLAGKQIRVLSDRRQAKGDHSRILDLYLLGIDVRLNSRRRLQHNKFAVADGRVSVSGSFNWTRSAARSNSEDLTVLKTGLLNWAENRSIQETEAKFEEDWEKNTAEKSEEYFETLLREQGAEARERLKSWIEKALKEGHTRSVQGARLLEAAFRSVEKLGMRDKSTLDLLARWAEPGSRSNTGARIAALRALGQARTADRDHHILLLMAAADSHAQVSLAAKEALAAIGELHPEARAYKGIGASLWRAGLFCRSLWRRAGL